MSASQPPDGSGPAAKKIKISIKKSASAALSGQDAPSSSVAAAGSWHGQQQASAGTADVSTAVQKQTAPRARKGRAASSAGAASDQPPPSPSPSTASASASAAQQKSKRGRARKAVQDEDYEYDGDFGAEALDPDPDDVGDWEDEEQGTVLGQTRKTTRKKKDGGQEVVEVDTNFRHLQLKPDHANRPLWVTPDGRVFLETFSPIYKQAYDFLIAIAEPVCRPECVHEYQLTPHSLYAAVSVGLETETIISVLNRLSKVQLSEEVKAFIRNSTQNYGKVKLVLKRNRFWVESPYADVLHTLLRDSVIAKARTGTGDPAAGGLIASKALKERAAAHIAKVQDLDLSAPPVPEEEEEEEGEGAEGEGRPEEGAGGAKGAGAGGKAQGPGQAQGGALVKVGGVWQQAKSSKARGQGGAAAAAAAAAGTSGAGQEDGGAAARPRSLFEQLAEGVEEDPEKEVYAFEITPESVEHVKQRCLPGGLNYPMLEEYDFKHDTQNPDIHIELKPHVKLRPYQEKSLSKMFGNGRARSGIIVLPCGAGKSLVGVSAAARVKKPCLCLCTSSVSVDQWKHQFQLWTNLQDHQVARFTSESKEQFAGEAGVVITTFTMVAFSGKRSEESEKVMQMIQSREWGLLLMDEVHVVPAQMFRKVISITHSHCKLGLTATLVREDERIGDLNFLIGPKLYEANWLDLTRAGHIANVQCAEVWCPMTKEFYAEYLRKENAPRKQLLYVMNPNKFMACQFLIQYHEQQRGDKVIVFSDNIWALREYATRLGKPFIYGPTGHGERTRVLHAFKHDPNVNTVFLSKVGDNSLDIPEANVLIQISSHAGSRRQEAQRLGRILRAKRGKPGSGAEDEFNAFFYTLVSRDTQEMYYSTKRQQFLIDQGYSFKVITNLQEAVAESSLPHYYSERQQQLDLLARVLTTGLEEAGVETIGDADAEGMARSGKARRMAGSMANLSGAGGLSYLEWRSGGRGGRGGRAGYQGDKAKALGRKLLGTK